MRAQTTKSVRIQFVSLILAGLISMPAHAEVIPGRWEKVSAMELGTPITVALKNGDQIKGELESLSETEVELKTHSARASVPRSDIQSITAWKKDGLGNGAAIGAYVGAGFAGTIAITSGLAKSLDTDMEGALSFAALAVGIGAALGMAVDAEMKSDPIVLYEALGSPRRSKHEDSEWWPPDPPLSETQTANPSQ